MDCSSQDSVPSASGGDLPESTATLVQSVFQDVWTEFYAWEKDSCPLVFNYGECSTNAKTSTDVKTYKDARNRRLGEINTKVQQCIRDDLEMSDEEIEAPVFQPYPSYETCAPSSSNIWRGDDYPRMLFIPYADDPNFNHVEHSTKYDVFAWQSGDRDPDSKATTVQVWHRLTRSDIFQLKPLPLRPSKDYFIIIPSPPPKSTKRVFYLGLTQIWCVSIVNGNVTSLSGFYTSVLNAFDTGTLSTGRVPHRNLCHHWGESPKLMTLVDA
jgi:hypothetical protein